MMATTTFDYTGLARMWWLVGSLAVLIVLIVYIMWLSGRLQRLHVRAADASAALLAKLDERAETVLSLAVSHRDALGRHTEAMMTAAKATLHAEPPDREPAENDLTRILRGLPLPTEDPVWELVRRVNRRVAIARQIHTDIVRDALAVRDRRVVRMLRLNRRLDRPQYFNMDDPT